LERAGRFSRQQRASEVTPDHLLLGVLDVEGLACQVLRWLEVDLAALRTTIVGGAVVANRVVSTTTATPAVGGTAVRPVCPRCDAALDDTLAEVRLPARRAGRPPADVGVVYCAACGTTLGIVAADAS
jgi:hypothetical protein